MKLPEAQKKALRVKCAYDECSIFFIPKRPWQIYHHSNCRLRAWRKAHPEMSAAFLRDHEQLKRRVAQLEQRVGAKSKGAGHSRGLGKQTASVPARD